MKTFEEFCKAPTTFDEKKTRLVEMSEADYKQIQLDAWKQGMTDAAMIAEEADNHTCFTECKCESQVGSRGCHVKSYILTARDERKGLTC